jgi:hypothetical protein
LHGTLLGGACCWSQTTCFTCFTCSIVKTDGGVLDYSDTPSLPNQLK